MGWKLGMQVSCSTLHFKGSKRNIDFKKKESDKHMVVLVRVIKGKIVQK